MTDEENQEIGGALTYWALGFFCGAVCASLFFFCF